MTLILPTPEVQVHIRKILNENVHTRNSDLELVKEWLRKQPHLPNTYDEKRLLNFLRGCRFSVEKCKRKLDMYFSMRGREPRFFTNRDVRRPELQSLRSFLQGAVLPKLTPDGKRISIGRGMTPDIPEIPDLANLIKILFMVGDIRLGTEEHGVSGDIYIIDVKYLQMKHLLKIQMSVVKNFFMCVQDAYPLLIESIHLVNVSPFVSNIINWIKPLIKDKIFQRIHLHKDIEDVYRFVPKELLPVEYGGSIGKMEDFVEDWHQKLIEWVPWFQEEENVKADETKRPEQYDDVFGVIGTFRQFMLDID